MNVLFSEVPRKMDHQCMDKDFINPSGSYGNGDLQEVSFLFIFYRYLTSHNGKELNLVRCGARNMTGLDGDIPPQKGQPAFLSIARNKAYTKGWFIRV